MGFCPSKGPFSLGTGTEGECCSEGGGAISRSRGLAISTSARILCTRYIHSEALHKHLSGGKFWIARRHGQQRPRTRGCPCWHAAIYASRMRRHGVTATILGLEPLAFCLSSHSACGVHLSEARCRAIQPLAGFLLLLVEETRPLSRRGRRHTSLPSRGCSWALAGDPEISLSNKAF